MLSLSIIAAISIGPPLGQDKPVDVPKKDLPPLATCLLCKDEHGQEKPAGGVVYKGKTYYFCNANEIKAFKSDPEGHVPPVLPRPSPAFSLADEAGKVWNAESMKGKLVLIDWWATWCGPCKEMFPTLERIHAKYKGRGFEILSVSIDEKRAELDKYLKKKTFPNPVLHDTAKAWSDWGIRTIPAMFLVADGVIVAQWSGKPKEASLTLAIEANLPK